MIDFFFRTEDIPPEEIGDYFVESRNDREIVDALKNRNPTILIGSRGVGKSFLLRVAQKELNGSFDSDRVLPVYLSFVRSSLLQSSDPAQFKHWMLARICSTVVRTLMKAGMLGAVPRSAKLLAGTSSINDAGPTKIEEVADVYENSWRNPKEFVDSSSIPTVDKLKDALEDLSEELSLSRFMLLIDEAAHIFLPEQQRQFFTLFRDLRSHCVTCNAAVYPGVTSFGDTFQPAHDATMISIDRDVLASDYVANMREIVEKQADAKILKDIAQNARNFATLAYAASGNPRILLKTLAASSKVSSAQINETVREYYRTDIWAEHSLLADKYVGHREVIDWGRQFVEETVIPAIKAKNDQYLASDKKTSAYLWIHRDAPAVIKEALRVLSYTGVLCEQASGIKASRGEIGTRYMINLGCLFSLESAPASTSFEIARGLTPKRMTEFGANHSAYKSLVDHVTNVPAQNGGFAFEEQLTKPVSVLDISDWQRTKLVELGLKTVGDVFRASEAKLKEAMYVGDVRARRMRNAAVAAVLEYLSG
jgi:hypothetical protein